MEKYQPIQSKTGTSGQERGHPAFHVQENSKYKVIEFQSEIECLIIQKNFDTKTIRNFCLNTDTQPKNPYFLQEVEKKTRIFTAIEK